MLKRLICFLRQNPWIVIFLAGILLVFLSAPVGYSVGNQFTIRIGAMVTEAYVAFLDRCIQAVQITGVLTATLGILWFHKSK